MYSIDLNSDMGESFGAYKIGGDEENHQICDHCQCCLWMACRRSDGYGQGCPHG